MDLNAIYNKLSDSVSDARHKAGEVVENVSYYYPKTLAATLIGVAVFTLAIPTITSVATLALACYLIYPKRHTLLAALSVHWENHISEFGSTNEAKKSLIVNIAARALIYSGEELFNSLASSIKQSGKKVLRFFGF